MSGLSALLEGMASLRAPMVGEEDDDADPSVSSSTTSGLSALLKGMTDFWALLEDMSGLSLLLEAKAGKIPNLNQNYYTCAVE